MSGWFTASNEAIAGGGGGLPVAGTTGTFSGAVTGASFTATGNVAAGSGSAFLWTSRSRMTSPADGVITLGNAAGTAFTRLGFGGASASFPALSRNGAILEVKFADDSGFAQITASNIFTSKSDGTIAYGNSGNGMAIGSNVVSFVSNSLTALRFHTTTAQIRQYVLMTQSKTANYTISTSSNFDSGSYFDNTGAAGTVVFTLPLVSQGLGQVYGFHSTVAQIITVTANAADKIGNKAAGSSYSCLAAIGSYIEVVAIAANQWAIRSNNGFT